ncbi:KamA family radical SAM protein [Clostridiaceae bacterium OttesenSCG-928-D20]|nr:KamA family radical SAM protein [Clostridiaceae bacterium OttesenSCG-928-D20]
MLNSREISLKRAQELSSYAEKYAEARKNISFGTSDAVQKSYSRQKDKLLKLLCAAESDWNDWKWQFRNRISDAETLSKILPLSEADCSEIEKIGESYRWAITPYYLSLIDESYSDDPIAKMSIPQSPELIETGEKDPMGEEFTNPCGSITRRYPDRLIINVTNACAMFCRHCQRRRKISDFDSDTPLQLIDESIEYIKNSPEIRDVLITGGDALALSDKRLDDILTRLRQIPHVEIIRLGTRMPVTLPQRVTSELCEMLKKHHPIYVNVQFNHPREMTLDAKKACEMLANSGIPLGNQMVLLKGVNNDKYTVAALNHELLKARVKPYYIFHAKKVIGTAHFQTSIEEGLEIMEYLRGNTSGMAIPAYIINAPKGQGKTPILPQYLIGKEGEKLKFRTWEGKTFEY